MKELKETVTAQSKTEQFSEVDPQTLRVAGQKAVARAIASRDTPEPERLYLGFYQEKDMLMKRIWSQKNEKYYEFTLCDYFKVLERQRNIVTGEISYLIEFEAFDELVRETIPRKNLEAKKLLDNHIALGAPFVNVEANADIVKYIMEEAEKLPPISLSPILGWVRNRTGELAYVCGNYALVKDNGDNNGVDRFIRYCGKLKLSTKGNANEAIAGLNTFLKDSVPLQAAASFGLAAPLVYPLKVNEVNTITVHLAPNSTSGKSTAASLAVSMNADPVQSKKGLNQKCYKTQNHLTQMLCGNHGFPFGLDEIGIAKFTQDEAFGYLLASGIEKGRYESEPDKSYNSEPDKSGYGQDEWRTLIVTTGEKYIVNDKIPDGAKIRIIELNEKWTHSAEHAESLMAFLKEQHGTIGLRFVKELLKMGEPALKAEYKKVLEIVKAKAPPDKLAQRFAGTLAIIVTASVLGNKLTGLEINPDMVTDFLLSAATLDSLEVPLAERAVDYIKSKILEIDRSAFFPSLLAHVKKSGYVETYIFDRDGAIGKIYWEELYKPVEVVLTVKCFERIVSEIGDIKAVKKALIAGGYLIGQANGQVNGKDKTIYYKKRSFRGSELTVIGFDAMKIGLENNKVEKGKPVEVDLDDRDSVMILSDGTDPIPHKLPF